MAKPNYSFEKRQRELAKKKKQDEKDARKRQAREANAQRDPEPTAAGEPAAGHDDDGSQPAELAPRVHLRRQPDSA